MQLFVKLLEARNLKPSSDRPCQAYARFKFGNEKQKSQISPNGAKDPYWFEDFRFDVNDCGAELIIYIWIQDRLGSVCAGCLRFPISEILSSRNQTLPSSWYPLQKKNPKSKVSPTGEVRVLVSLSDSTSSDARQADGDSKESIMNSTTNDLHDRPTVPGTNTEQTSDAAFSVFFFKFLIWLLQKLKGFLPETLVDWLSQLLGQEEATTTDMEEVSRSDSLEAEGPISASFFDDDGNCKPCSQQDMPPPLRGGILLSHTYKINAKALNAMFFGPECQFQKDLTKLQNAANLVEKPWTMGEHGFPKRVITYVKTIKAMGKTIMSNASEEQVYSRADDTGFVMNISAITPDVPYGKTFKVHVQYCIFAGSNTSSGEKTSLLRISWEIEFLSSTMMKAFIEKSTRQALEEFNKQHVQLLERHVNPLEGSTTEDCQVQDSEASKSDVTIPASRSNWQTLKMYLFYLRLCATFGLTGLIVSHIYISNSDMGSKLEVWRIDLPDSFTELIIASILGAQFVWISKFAMS
ncbi:hypothetical protein KP509_16G027000 [Ceratopteris richardii]|uniref:C2 domain-containing protein n=1 Tax=Ceratopteris richardii TaxID=49495 RepID=A0A8T2T1V4_CERRI|nr:hypothetical protein KP509_16G027000 [Ceratopteris richardii]